jgi:hypothetical protein
LFQGGNGSAGGRKWRQATACYTIVYECNQWFLALN